MVRFKNIIFVTYFFIIFIFISYIISYNKKQDDIILISNNYNSENYVVFFDDEIEKWKDMKINKGCRIFIECDGNIRFLLNSNNWNPPVIKGTFLTECTNDRQAVIGKKVKEKLKNSGNEKIEVFNESYKVIGTLGTNYSSKADTLVFLSGGQIPKQDKYKIILDGDSKKSISSMIRKIKNKYPDLKYIEPDIEGMAKITGTLLFRRMLNLNTVILSGIAVVIFLNFWIIMYQDEMYTLLLLGISTGRIKIDYLKRIIKNLIYVIILGNLFGFAVMEDRYMLLKPKSIIILVIYVLFCGLNASILLKYRWNKIICECGEKNDY